MNDPIAPLSRDRMRQCDRRAIEDFGVPGVVLMENAGRGCAEVVRTLLPEDGGRVVILAGKGNNGGDGHVIARHLANAGVDVRVLLFADPDEVKGDAAVNLHILEKMAVSIESYADAPPANLPEHIERADVVVDALLGTGVSGEVKGKARTVIEAVNDSGRPVVAVDIPSGLDADTGRPLGVAVKARATATMAAPKQGFEAPGAAGFTGEVTVIDIGMPRSILREASGG